MVDYGETRLMLDQEIDPATDQLVVDSGRDGRFPIGATARPALRKRRGRVLIAGQQRVEIGWPVLARLGDQRQVRRKRIVVRGTSGDLVLCSAPSVALGSVGPDMYRGSFHVNELALTGGGGMRLTSSERVMV